MQLQVKQIAGLATALKAPFSVSETAPENPVANQIWLQLSTLALYVFIVGTSSAAWVEIN